MIRLSVVRRMRKLVKEGDMAMRGIMMKETETVGAMQRRTKCDI